MSQQGTILFALVPLLSNTALGLPSVALVADLVALDARFNDWMAADGKRTLSDDGILEALDAYDEACSLCMAAVSHFHATGALEELDVALGNVREALQRARAARVR